VARSSRQHSTPSCWTRCYDNRRVSPWSFHSWSDPSHSGKAEFCMGQKGKEVTVADGVVSIDGCIVFSLKQGFIRNNDD